MQTIEVKLQEIERHNGFTEWGMDSIRHDATLDSYHRIITDVENKSEKTIEDVEVDVDFPFQKGDKIRFEYPKEVEPINIEASPFSWKIRELVQRQAETEGLTAGKPNIVIDAYKPAERYELHVDFSREVDQEVIPPGQTEQKIVLKAKAYREVSNVSGLVFGLGYRYGDLADGKFVRRKLTVEQVPKLLDQRTREQYSAWILAPVEIGKEVELVATLLVENNTNSIVRYKPGAEVSTLSSRVELEATEGTSTKIVGNFATAVYSANQKMMWKRIYETRKTGLLRQNFEIIK